MMSPATAPAVCVPVLGVYFEGTGPTNVFKFSLGVAHVLASFTYTMQSSPPDASHRPQGLHATAVTLSE